MTAELQEELRRACIDSCKALRKAYRNLVRRNVEAICRDFNVQDRAITEKMVELTLRELELL